MRNAKLRPCMHCGFLFLIGKLQCPSCRQFNNEPIKGGENDGTYYLGDADDQDVAFVATGDWDPCFGREIKPDGSFHYGIPKSSITLLGGKNGAGKSTLVLQICEEFCEQGPEDVIIVSVEEASAQVKRLGKRLKLKHMKKQSEKTGGIRISKGENEMAAMLHFRKPSLIVVDSLPRLCPDMDDAVEFTKRLKEHIIALGIPAIIINHINKEEEFAGLEKLQHEVDCTMIFTIYDDDVRELRSIKNRNGLPARVYFDMTDLGLVKREDDADDEESQSAD